MMDENWNMTTIAGNGNAGGIGGIGRDATMDAHRQIAMDGGGSNL